MSKQGALKAFFNNYPLYVKAHDAKLSPISNYANYKYLQIREEKVKTEGTAQQ